MFFKTTKLVIVALVAFVCLINPKPAKAAISDCASQGCFAVCTYAGPINFYFNDGSLAGTVSGVGTGSCRLSAGEGYLSIARNDTIFRTYDVENETLYSLDIGQSAGDNVIFNGYVYVTSSGDDSVKKIDLNCSGITSISLTGDHPQNITHDGTTIYVINVYSADISTIDPPYTTSTTHNIGRVLGDMVGDVKYHAGNDVLYVAGLAGIYEVELPINGTSTVWQSLPSRAGYLSLTNTNIGVNSMDGDSAYLVPVTNPSGYYTMGCVSCASVAINDTTLYTAGGNTPDLNVRAWNMSGVQESYSPMYTASAHAVAWLAPTVTPPSCGDNVMEGTEECDGSDFGSTPPDCTDYGFDGGSLSCSGSCTIETAGCYYNCGNGSIDSGEDCDGSNLNNTSCTDLGFSSGTLSCDANCEFVTTQCVSPTCGDGTVDSGEDCDGDNNGETCESLGFDGGQLSCSETSCTFDTSLCSTCGNNTLEFGEECDTQQFGGETCQSQGFDGGSLSCSTSCTLDTSACTGENPCGNGILENGEQCDDGNINAGDGCDDNCQIEEGYICEGEPSDCTLQNTCNQDGLVADSDSGLELSKLSDHNLELYDSHLANLTKGYTLACGIVEIYGNELDAITVNLEGGSYTDLALQIGDKIAQCHFFAEEGPAMIHIAKEDISDTYVDPSAGSGAGVICTEDNANVNVQFQGLILGALGTGFSYRRLSTHPVTQSSGEWLEIYVSDSSIRLQEMVDPTNSVVVATSDTLDRPIYINLTAIGDLSEVFDPPKPPKEGCGCSSVGSSTGTLPIPFLIMFALLVIRRRKKSEIAE